MILGERKTEIKGKEEKWKQNKLVKKEKCK